MIEFLASNLYPVFANGEFELTDNPAVNDEWARMYQARRDGDVKMCRRGPTTRGVCDLCDGEIESGRTGSCGPCAEANVQRVRRGLPSAYDSWEGKDSERSKPSEDRAEDGAGEKRGVADMQTQGVEEHGDTSASAVDEARSGRRGET